MQWIEDYQKEATKSKPSFPNLVDEYQPTNERLWKDVLDVASGGRRDLTILDRTINSPNDGRGYRGMPSNPKGIAWAIKQYKGFGGGFKKRTSSEEGTVVRTLGSPRFPKKDVSDFGWGQRLARMAAGGIEVTEGQDPEAIRLIAEGKIKLAGTRGPRCYWDLVHSGVQEG